MTSSTAMKSKDAIVTPPTTEEGRKILLKDIATKWNKFSEQETTAMKSKDDLVTQLVAKYSMEKAQAQHDADAFLKGRQF
jgi:hypothetical protein